MLAQYVIVQTLERKMSSRQQNLTYVIEGLV